MTFLMRPFLYRLSSIRMLVTFRLSSAPLLIVLASQFIHYHPSPSLSLRSTPATTMQLSFAFVFAFSASKY
ncbi:hypothetical protein DL96DRAFT_1589475 [Flagelloscypha sp. PMI_526]|nr:hypothetical protein DL96DRAFT_1589475 [Flagelloscypha sp. PMI_526]